MSWTLGKYYTRSKRVDGRIIREYVGGGEAGRLAAQQDEEHCESIRQQHEAARQLMAELKEVDMTVASFCDLADLAARVAMQTAGYYQHHRSEWRKHRVKKHDNQA